METKSLIVGVLIGVCICLGAMIVLGQGVETAVAGPAPNPARYQLSVAGEAGTPYVIDRMTGTVYRVKSALPGGGFRWCRVIDGPPAGELLGRSPLDH